MELLFLWIKDFRNISNQGFVFTSQYNFLWTSDFENEKFILEIKSNDNFIPNFFGSNIANVSGIVGANGTGKSNLIDFLQLVFSNGASNYDWIGVFYDRSKKKTIAYHSLFDFEIDKMKVSRSETWSVEVNANFAVEVAGLEIGQPNMYDQAHLIGASALEDSRVLFYSPFLDLRNSPAMSGTSWEKIYNVGQNMLIREDIDNHAFRPEEDVIERHKLQNVQRQFQFVQTNAGFVKEVNLPTTIGIRFYKLSEIDKSDLGDNARNFYELFEHEMRRAMDIPNSLMVEGREKNNSKMYFDGLSMKVKYWFLRNLVNNFLLNLERYTYINNEKMDRVGSINDFDPKSPELIVKRFFDEQELISPKKFDFKIYIDFILGVIAEKSEFDSDEDNEAFFTVGIDDAKMLLDQHQKYVAAFKKDAIGFMSMDWRSVSSGEKAYLDLFSRLDYGLAKIDAEKMVKDSVIFVLIDEGDISFHPKWQKEYLDKLLSFFTAKNHYHYQLFLTTHSPYLVSDLPHGNVVLIGSKNKGFGKGRQRTFGANIHELLSDSFFMGETLFGDFAYKKINEVFRWAEGKIDLDSKYARKVIDLVDEPLLHYKLLQLYYKKTGENQQTGYLRSQIETLQRKLKSLEGGGNDKN